MLCDENCDDCHKMIQKWLGIVSSIFRSHGSILKNLESQSLFGYNKNFFYFKPLEFQQLVFLMVRAPESVLMRNG